MGQRKLFDLTQYSDMPSSVAVGICYDGTSTFYRGCRDAPDAIRRASVSIETYSLRQEKDLTALSFNDAGNWYFEGSAEVMCEELYRQSLPFFQNGTFTVFIGGEHAITFPLFRAASEVYPNLHLMIFDAHLDLREQFGGDRLNHCTYLRRLYEMVSQKGKIWIFGVRSAIPEEVRFARDSGIGWMSPEQSEQKIADFLRIAPDEPVYVSIDFDVLDPSDCPAVSNPEPGGFSFSQLLNILFAVRSFRVIGMDFVELNPHLDFSRHSAVTASVLIRESMLLWGR